MIVSCVDVVAVAISVTALMASRDDILNTSMSMFIAWIPVLKSRWFVLVIATHNPGCRGFLAPLLSIHNTERPQNDTITSNGTVLGESMNPVNRYVNAWKVETHRHAKHGGQKHFPLTHQPPAAA